MIQIILNFYNRLLTFESSDLEFLENQLINDYKFIDYSNNLFTPANIPNNWALVDILPILTRGISSSSFK